MNRLGPIIVIEDDPDDQEILKEVFESLAYPNEIMFFFDGESALKFLTEIPVDPFIIFSDINMPRLSGMELRERIHQNESMRLKSIPYLFFSTTAEQAHVIDAYSKSVQGFFIKPNSYNEIKDIIKIVVEYWSRCVAPNYIK
ncbi:response regulator [Aquiflexum sp. TKW24L]|uniref:response regulator n=1 Tax=Aquiflexum sp. TKW24L TaxID=2942212 RepID=UPI0020BD954A|nr:response regulator [Aquiflexum sp. TKW24L]MCL6261060.1 response regulator [Aquiflexum sp. TKW24L]